jgi:Rieske Fe-S protein
MQHSIPEWVSQQSPKPKPAARPSRRSVLFASAASLAAGVAATLGVERLTEHETPPYQQALVPNGTWTAVKAVADLPQGIPIAFRSGAIEGFLVRNGDKVDGLSAVCTHMGCILNYSKIRNQFECPCHGATFAVNGEPNGNYQQPLRRLPWLDVRIQRGQVEVYSV